MKTPLLNKGFIVILLALLTVGISSCSKNDELTSFEGVVVNPNGDYVVNATIKVFQDPEDWLTGHNVIATMQSDLVGHFESAKIFDAGEYYIFVEKYDSSNWEIRSVEQGVYPTVSIPGDPGTRYTVDYNNMSLLASTNWVLTNVHREYTKPGSSVKEWQSIWSSVNNCRRDNSIVFNKDLSMRVSEGDIVCSGEVRNILGTFVPPLIFSANSCKNLPYTSQGVKEFEFDGWPQIQSRGGKMYMDCNQSIGQIYVNYTGDDGLMRLDVYSRR